MKTSVIRHRVADFLQRHTPFDALSQDDLLELAGSGKVRFHESEEYVLREGDAKGEFVWVIQQGRVETLKASAAGEMLRDVCGEGDVLGLELLAGDGTAAYSARTATDVILYGISTARFEAAIARYPAIQRFLAAQRSLSGIFGFKRDSWLDAETPSLPFLRARLRTVRTGTPHPEACAAAMQAPNGAAAIVDDAGRLTRTISAWETRTTELEECASRPQDLPLVIGVDYNTRSAIRQMLQSGVDLLAITAEGRPEDALQAILTAGDLALFCGRHPVGLVRAVRHAASPDEIQPLMKLSARMVDGALARPEDVDDCCQINTELLWALTSACIRLADAELSEAGFERPVVKHCWVVFGAAARGDLLSLEFPTIAAIYDDASEALQPTDSMYFTALAGQTAEQFHALGLTGPGFSWPDGAGPSMPLSEWKRFFSETIADPRGKGVYHRRAFFDMSPVFGDQQIAWGLQQSIGEMLAHSPDLVPELARRTLAHVPPLAFFRGLVLGEDGSQREEFDVDEVLLTPIAQAARVFALAGENVDAACTGPEPRSSFGGFYAANTQRRLLSAASRFPEGDSVLRQAAEAFRLGLFYQAISGGSLIRPSQLEKFEQLLLKTAFDSVRKLLEFTGATLAGATGAPAPPS
ncbi:MAG: cyclic nucleotide-binding domain-containing protein [Bryobacterales bacterium]|nr:cyclic nucleotide-binding domain-containing protein [Bryobacterales bacterium]